MFESREEYEAALFYGATGHYLEELAEREAAFEAAEAAKATCLTCGEQRLAAGFLNSPSGLRSATGSCLPHECTTARSDYRAKAAA